MVNRSPSANTLRAQSPTPRTPDSSCAAHKKIPWVNPLGTPRHHVIYSNAQELPQREQGSRGRAALPTHKENDARGTSPAPPCSKGGTKNFMAPTISASSKVIAAASPRRRVLSERNDATRSSLNSSSITDSVESLGSFGFDAKSRGAMYTSLQDDLDLAHVRRWESEVVGSGELHIPPPPPPFYASHSPDSAANTSLPPYDPETNYLSPRPQFLHYKPKPRADPEDGKHLEGSFSSESCQESPERSEDAQSSVTRKSLEEEEEEEEEECEISSTVEFEVGETSREKITAHPIETAKSGSFFRAKFATFLVLLTIACFGATITDTPLIPSPTSLPNRDLVNHFAPTFGTLKDPSVGNYLSKAANFGDSALEGFGKLFNIWSANLVARFPPILPHEERGLFRPVNLTSVADEENLYVITETSSHSVGLDSDMDKASEAETKEPFTVVNEVLVDADDGRHNYLNDESHEELEFGLQIVGADGYLSEVGPRSVALEATVEEEKAESVTAEPEAGETESLKIDSEINDEEEEQHRNEEIINHSLPVVAESAAEAKEQVDGVLEPSIEDDATVELKSSDIKPPKIELVESMEEIGGEEEEVMEVKNGGPAEMELGVKESAGLSEQVVGDDTEPSADAIRSKSPWGIMLALSTCVIAIAAAAVVSFYVKKTRPSSSTVAEMTTQPPKASPERNTSVPDSSCSNMQFQTQGVLHGDYPTEIETLHESGPAASSSLHNTSLKSRKTPRKVVEEADVLSREGKPRRDSTASSASFGSFTTYEKRSGKKGGQEEVVTPVRRSSRIRNQLTSP